MEKEYIVVVNRGVDLEEFDAEMSATQGHGPIPNRSVDIANPRIGSRRMTHWMITDAEAEDLRNDPRVLSVEIPPEQRDDIQIGLHAYQSGNFFRGTNDATDVNWGLRRSIEETNVYADATTIAGDYEYALDGTGVDIVIQDSGIQPGHPEWEDADGNTRLQQIDWYAVSGLSGSQSVNHYRDRDGHGTHCAGIAAGKTYGWAKGAHIYSQKLAGLETLQGPDGTGISIADSFDAIRLWHAAKTNGRPTIVNMSWGYTTTVSGDPLGGSYRGTSWTYASEDDNTLWDNYGIVSKYGDGARRLPAQVASVDAEIEDMIDAGIHVCIAAGNDYFKADINGGADYNNSVTFTGLTRFYHRPSSPYSDRAFCVGNLDSNVFDAGAVFLDRTAGSSKKGPAVNVWAPGTDIMSTSSNEADAAYTLFDYPADTNYKIMSISGTSMASPQVAGVLALYLQSIPSLTPATLREKIINDSKNTLVQTVNNDSDYRDFTTSILGSPNRHLYSRYGIQPIVLSTPISITGPLTIAF
jgi:subtilisin family serine protease